MAQKLVSIDNYIAICADFAKPILLHLRGPVHTSCPQVEEKNKWGFPHFDYRGEMMCSMAAFKQHAVFGFWKGSLMKDPALIEIAKSEVAMGHLGRITSLKDLPADKKLAAWVKEAMELNDKAIKLPAKTTAKEKKEIIMPDYFEKLLANNDRAATTFYAFSNFHKKEYVEWITGAKTDETRNRRMAKAIEMLAGGEALIDKYAVKK
jgi:uncharacterized protein YdeI (YjbR/CyaY-like superfamily)